MPKSMKRSPDSSNVELPAHDLKITLRVPHRHHRARLRRKDARMLVLGKVPIQRLAELNAHWYEALFVALSLNLEHHVVEVHILARKSQDLIQPKAGIKRNHAGNPDPRFVTPDGLPVRDTFDLLRAER